MSQKSSEYGQCVSAHSEFGPMYRRNGHTPLITQADVTLSTDSCIHIYIEMRCESDRPPSQCLLGEE